MASAYPTVSDVTDYLSEQGLDAPANLQAHVDAAIEEWERLTGYRPFLAETSDSSSYYDPVPLSEVLDLGTGFVSITSVHLGVSRDDDDGTVLTLGDDYEPVPLNRQDTPIDGIRFFAFALSGRPRSIKVVGKRGYASTVPNDAWHAILVKAAINAKQGTRLAGVSSIREGDLSIAYGDGGAAPSEMTTWQVAIRRYTRMPL